MKPTWTSEFSKALLQADTSNKLGTGSRLQEEQALLLVRVDVLRRREKRGHSSVGRQFATTS